MLAFIKRKNRSSIHTELEVASLKRTAVQGDAFKSKASPTSKQGDRNNLDSLNTTAYPLSLSERNIPRKSKMGNLSKLSTNAYNGSSRAYPIPITCSQPINSLLSPVHLSNTDDSISELNSHEITADV